MVNKFGINSLAWDYTINRIESALLPAKIFYLPPPTKPNQTKSNQTKPNQIKPETNHSTPFLTCERSIPMLLYGNPRIWISMIRTKKIGCSNSSGDSFAAGNWMKQKNSAENRTSFGDQLRFLGLPCSISLYIHWSYLETIIASYIWKLARNYPNWLGFNNNLAQLTPMRMLSLSLSWISLSLLNLSLSWISLSWISLSWISHILNSWPSSMHRKK